MRLVTQLGIVVLLIALALGAWQWTASDASAPATAGSSARQPRPVAVATATARLGTITEEIEVVGTARARNAIDVVATSAGQITRIAFEAGQHVAANELLVELDAASEKAAVLEAESELDNLRRQVERARALLSRNLSSDAEVEDLEAQVKAAQARLAAAHSRLEKRTLRAPFAGTVGLKNVSIGDYVDTSTVLTTLDDLSTVELDFEVPERFFGAVKRGQRIQATSAAFPERTFNGTVRTIDTRINPSTRSFRVRAELPNPTAALPDGIFMTASLIIEERLASVLIPEEAVIADGEQRYVFVVRDETAARVPIEMGLRAGAEIEVRSGLAPGAVVVTKGHQRLRDAAPVQLVQQ